MKLAPAYIFRSGILSCHPPPNVCFLPVPLGFGCPAAGKTNEKKLGLQEVHEGFGETKRRAAVSKVGPRALGMCRCCGFTDECPDLVGMWADWFLTLL